MTLLKSLGVIAVLATMTAPVLARDTRPRDTRLGHLGIHWSHHHLRDAYNQRNEGFDRSPQFQRNTESSFRGPDHSRIGGEDPDLHPSAY
jgi:hypothetical protein